jgi:leucyl-tRNA synthetase/predicted alpha/beta hydrolase family esterase
MDKYNPKEIEQKWQKFWEENKIFSTPEDVTTENKCYILPQLPYPSGYGLHVGHAEVYTACDIYARYQRMKGKKVLQVFGLDSFGLPAENYAIKTNVHPKQTIDETGANFVSQVKALGCSVDWDKFVRSSDPEYYKFTQWFFLLMYERGLAYRKTQSVNWCDSCKTVLANAQVVDGNCERCDTAVVQKEMEQWYLKITDYAEKLLDGFDRIDWPEETIKRQKDWIGKSEGADVEFKISDSSETITVFTTRPDTLFGTTYMVLAPEGEYVQQLKEKIENWNEIEVYIKETSKKTELDRQTEKEKTGIELKGVKAINPANGEQIPVWIADYVIATYGTGAIMAVPAHDERDFEFAKKFGLVVKNVVAKTVGDYVEGEEKCVGVYGILEKDKKVLVMYQKSKDLYRLPGGTQEASETDEQALLREFTEETGYKNVKLENFVGQVGVHFISTKSKDPLYYVRKAFVISLQDEEKIALRGEDEGAYEYYWMKKEEALVAFEKNKTSSLFPHDTGEGLLLQQYYDGQDEFLVEYGTVVNSDFLNGLRTVEAKASIIDWLEEKGHGKRKVQYKLRDWSVSRQRFWGAPLPMLVNEEEKNKKQQYVFIHGYTATKESVFWPWLKKELESQGHSVWCEDLPNTDKPNAKDQAKFVLQNAPINENTIIITHSHGGPVTFRLLEQLDKKIEKVLFVDVFYKPEFPDKKRPDVEASDSYNFDFESIKTHANEFTILHDSLGRTIDRDQAEYMAKKLDARLVYREGVGDRHFDAAEEPDVLDEVSIVGIKPVPFSDLPVLLPDDVDFKPTGQSPLTYSKDFQKGVEKTYGSGWKREVNTLDTFMCSSWYFFRYLDPHNEKEFASPEALKKWMPVDFYLGGPEHVNGHLLYSRFFTKVLFDAGYIDFDEPFTVHRHQGLVFGPDGRKMSKRWNNVINPTDVIDVYGADTMRMYEMFMGPLEDDKPWDENGVKGIRRFLDKFFDYYKTYYRHDEKELEQMLCDKSILKAIRYADRLKLLHNTIKKVEDDLQNLKFNTAISSLMILLNEIRKETHDSDYGVGFFFYKGAEMKDIVKLLAPFAPHMAEEIWSGLGHEDTIAFEPWPECDESKLMSDTLTLAVQVNGKVRATIEVAVDASKDDVEAVALAENNVKKWLNGANSKKVIYVKGKIVNVVV